MLRVLAPALAAALLAGCVERIVAVRTEPPGAVLYVDGEKCGETPCEVRYVWYGTREISLERQGFKTVREMLPLRPPWWQIFPLDFVTDVLLPFTVTDRLEVEYVLERATRTTEERDDMRRRAAELREKAGGPR